MAKISTNQRVSVVARGQQGSTSNACQGGLFLTESASSLSDPEMQSTGYTVVGFPTKIRNARAGWTRAVAIID